MMVVMLDLMEDETETGIVRRSPTIFQQKEDQLATTAKLGIPKTANEARLSPKPPDREDALMTAMERLTEMIATNIRVSRSLVVRPPPPKSSGSYTRAAASVGMSSTKTLEQGVRDGEVDLHRRNRGTPRPR